MNNTIRNVVNNRIKSPHIITKLQIDNILSKVMIILTLHISLKAHVVCSTAVGIVRRPDVS